MEASDANTALAAAELSLVTETLNAQLAVLKLTKAAGKFKPDAQQEKPKPFLP
jgi:hypothetical protein